MAQAVTLPLRTVGVIFFSGLAGSALYSNTQVVTGIFGELLRVTADRLTNGHSGQNATLVPENGGAHASAINAIAEQVRALTAEVQRGGATRVPTVTLYSGSGGRVPWFLVTVTGLTGAYILRQPLCKLLKVAFLIGKDTFWVSPDKLAEIRQALQSQMLRLDTSFRDFSGSISNSVQNLSERLDSSIEFLSTKMAQDNEVTRKEVNRVGGDVELIQEAMEELATQLESVNEATAFSKQGITLLCTIVSNSLSRDAPSYNELQAFVGSSSKQALGTASAETKKLERKRKDETLTYQTQRLGHGLPATRPGLQEFNDWKDGRDSRGSSLGVRFATLSGDTTSTPSRSGEGM